MPFDLESWKAKLNERLQGWRPRMQHLGVQSAYAAVSAAALLPVYQAYQQEGVLAVGLALGQLVGAVGGNLIANQIQGWKDKSEAEIVQAIETQAVEDEQFLTALDQVLEKLDALPQAREALNPDDRAWFEETLGRELSRYGSSIQYQFVDVQVRASTIGDRNIVVGKEGIVVGKAGGDVIGSGGEKSVAGEDVIRGVTVIVAKDGGTVVIGELPVEISAVDRQSSLGRYLEYVIANNRYLQLQGIRSGGRLVNIELDQIYITLRSTPQRSLQAEEEWLAGEAARAPGEMSRTRLEKTQEMQITEMKVEQALAGSRHFVILGDPGSGKTTLLRYLALLFARDLALGRTEIMEKLQLKESGALPILIPLRRVGAFLQVHHPMEDGTEGSGLLIEFLLQSLKNERIHMAPDFFDPYLKEGKAILLLDGLDEVADPDLRRRVSKLIESIAAAYPGCRVVVTSRVKGYSGAARLSGDFGTCTVRDFTMENVERFLTHWHRLVAVGQMGAVESAETYAVRQTQALMIAIRGNERIRELAINPLMLTVIALVHRDRVKLPDRRAELYAEAVDVLLGKWDEARGVSDFNVLPGMPFDAGDRRLMLQQVALEMHEREEKEISSEVLDRLLSTMFGRILPDPGDLRRAVERFLEVIEERSGLLTARGEGMYSYSHLTFQEYLAALAITGRSDYLEYTLERCGIPWWREVVLLEAGHLSMQSKERTTALIQAIADKPDGTEPFYNLVLAGECLRDVGSYRVEGNLAGEFQRRLRLELETPAPTGWLGGLRIRLQRGMSPEQLAFRRVAAAGALAQIGGEAYWSGSFGEPEWLEIPAGEFWMGSDKYGGEEQPIHLVYLPSYKIACVPVTNTQYAIFVQESGHKSPDGWDEGRIPRGKENHPVVNVTWYDAMAYCTWLGQATGKAITLPSEAEWEKAARGGDQRSYPWGDVFDPTRCNSADLGLNGTTPVGIFQEGASSYGVLDMSGNVWEWTRSLWGEESTKPTYGYPYQSADGREALDAPDNIRRVLRGGAFYNNGRGVRCAYRDWGNPYLRLDRIGFRVVVSPSDSEL